MSTYCVLNEYKSCLEWVKGVSRMRKHHVYRVFIQDTTCTHSRHDMYSRYDRYSFKTRCVLKGVSRMRKHRVYRVLNESISCMYLIHIVSWMSTYSVCTNYHVHIVYVHIVFVLIVHIVCVRIVSWMNIHRVCTHYLSYIYPLRTYRVCSRTYRVRTYYVRTHSTYRVHIVYALTCTDSSICILAYTSIYILLHLKWEYKSCLEWE